MPELRFVGRGGGGLMAVRATADGILEKALDGERIDDAEARRAARVARPRRGRPRRERAARAAAPIPSRITFIVDRNINYTNICVTDCDFCAFYRRPGDRREGYLLPKPVIFKKIEETLALGGTGAADAGRPPPGPRHRVLRGPLPLDQGALPDPPARALAAGDPAHLAPLEADDPGHAHPAARRRPRLDPRRRRRDPRRPRARRSSRRRRRRRPSG